MSSASPNSRTQRGDLGAWCVGSRVWTCRNGSVSGVLPTPQTAGPEISSNEIVFDDDEAGKLSDVVDRCGDAALALIARLAGRGGPRFERRPERS